MNLSKKILILTDIAGHLMNKEKYLIDSVIKNVQKFFDLREKYIIFFRNYLFWYLKLNTSKTQ